MTTVQDVDDLILATQRALERIRSGLLTRLPFELTRRARHRAQHAHAFPRRRSAPHRARVSRRAVVPEQRDARGDAPPHGRLRRRRSGAADDRRRRVWRRAACLLRWLLALRRRGRVYGDADVAAALRAAVPLGARLVRRAADCAWSRAAPRPSCRSTRRFSLPTCSTAITCTTRRSARRVDASEECDVCRCAGSSSSLRNGSRVRQLTHAQAPRRQRQEGQESKSNNETIQ
jgi:hypothetical protein